MLDIGGWEFLVVAFVLIMVVGPKELPKMLRGFTESDETDASNGA